MIKVKDVAITGVYIALLISGQIALGFVAGIEIVTALLAAFCYYFGTARSVILVTAFSLLRCIVFGFFPSVVILYLVYYNLFAVVISLIGKLFKKGLSPLKTAVVVLAAALLTVCFTLLDDVITPIYYGFNLQTAQTYFITSLPAMGVQTACAAITVATLFPLIIKVFDTCFKEYNKPALT